MVSEPTSPALWGRRVGCLSGIGTFLPGTGVQAVYAMSEPTSRVLWGRGVDCLRDVGTYLPCNMGQWCRLFKWSRNLLPGLCGAMV